MEKNGNDYIREPGQVEWFGDKVREETCKGKRVKKVCDIHD